MNVRPLASLLAVCLLAITLTACSSSDDPGAPPPPPNTPQAVDDLKVTAGAEGQVTLQWTSPELEAKSDYSVRYDLRTMPYGSEGAAWDQWTPLTPPGSDTAPGISHSFVVTGLTSGSVNVFMLRSSSDGAEWSAGSNMAVGTASPDHDTTAPDPISDLTQIGGTSSTLKIEWSVTGDDGPYGQAPHYQIRYSLDPITEQNWDQATLSADISITGAETVSHTISGLDAESMYYVAVKASDEADNVSGLSNVLSLETVDFRILHVFLDGSGDYPTIQAAVRNSQPGDLILVGPGHYTWTNQETADTIYGMINSHRGLDKVELRSTHGPAETILDAEKKGMVISITGGQVEQPCGDDCSTGITIDGFTITNGYNINDGGAADGSGGGMYAHLTDSVIRNCIIKENEATQGGGIWIGGVGAVVVENCTIIDNRARAGAGVLIVNSDQRVTIRSNVIRDNMAAVNGGGVLAYHAQFTLAHNLIMNNRAGSKGGGIGVYELELPNNEGCEITGNTIVDNFGTEVAGIYLETIPELTITNTIIANNRGGPPIKGVVVTGLGVGCTDVWGNEGVLNWPSATVDLGGNIELDPLFCNLSSYRLRSDSPCLPAASGCGQMGARGQGCTP